MAAVYNVLAQLRNGQDKLDAQPTVSAVEVAMKAVSEIEHQEIESLETLMLEEAPAGADADQFRTLQALKEERCRGDAELAKRKHLDVIELDRRHRQYHELISQAERALVMATTAVAGGGESGALATTPDYAPRPRPRQRSMMHDGFRAGGDRSADGVDDSDAGMSPSGSSVPSPGRFNPGLGAYTPQWGGGSGSFTPQGGSGSFQPTFQRGGVSIPSQGAGSTYERDMAAFAAVGPRGANPGGLTNYELLSSSAPGPERVPLSAVVGLGTIREHRSKLEVPGKLLKYIEDTAREGRAAFDVSTGFHGNLQWIPDTLGHLETLTDVNISSNQLVFLPDTIGQLSRLTRLDANTNQLAELPASIGDLKRLKVLNLHQNRLDELPPSLGECEALEELRLGFNNLRALPESLGQLSNLQRLQVHLNQLKRLPKSIWSLDRLTELDTHFNYLGKLPSELGQMTSLTRLNVAGNHYLLKELPSSIGALERLTELDISDNQIRALPDSFVSLTALRLFKCSGNPLVRPPQSVCQQGIEAIMQYFKTGGGDGPTVPITRRLSGLRGFLRKIGGGASTGASSEAGDAPGDIGGDVLGDPDADDAPPELEREFSTASTKSAA